MLLGTDLGRPWAADRLTDEVNGEPGRGPENARNLSGSSRQEPRWGRTARAEEPGVEQLQDYRLMTHEGR